MTSRDQRRLHHGHCPRITFYAFALLLLFQPALTGSVYTKKNAAGITSSRLVVPAREIEANRKFALLVGINEYAKGPPAISPLKGPENDVELMKKSLVSQFNFLNSEDYVMTLIGPRATKKNILDAFSQHLIENARKNQGTSKDEGAVVVFYFSGHGSQVTDKNGDEADGYDETILAYDSRTKGVDDIIDDEIDSLFKELSRYTSNITFILDSCHSGTTTKLIDSDIAVREVPSLGQAANVTPLPQNIDQASRDIANGILPRNGNYVAISSCLSFELAIETSFHTQVGRKRYGVMTYYLAQALQRNPNATYREIMRDVASAVTSKMNQTPQVEGDIDRLMFGVAADREDPPISFVGNVAGKTITIGAGAAQGLREGTFLAIYGPKVKKLTGDTGKLVNARVTEVSDFTAKAELAETPQAPIPRDAKVAIVTPSFGGGRLRVGFESVPDASTAAKINEFAGRLKVELRDSTLVEVVNAGARSPNAGSLTFDVLVRHGKLRDIKRFLRSKDVAQLPDTTDIYYLTKGGIDVPLYEFWITANDSDGPAKIRRSLELTAKQENIRSLDNATSSLKNKLKLTLVRVTGFMSADGLFRSNKEEARPMDQLGTPALMLGERFRFSVENNSDRMLFVTLLVLGTSGSVRILNDGKSPLQIPKGGKADFSCNVSGPLPCLQAGPPLGVETYKLIASTVDIDFRFIEQEGATPREVIVSPLQWLVDQASSGYSKDPTNLNAVKNDSWITAQVDLAIR